MGFIKDFLERRKERDLRMRTAEDDDRIFSTIHERKQSHWEREMIKGLEKEKQQCIKEALHWENKKRMADEKLKARNMMKFNPEMFNNESILKEKKIFLRGGDF